MLPSRAIGMRMLVFVFALIYAVVCYFAFVSLPDLKDSNVSNVRVGGGRFNPRLMDQPDNIIKGSANAFKKDAGDRIEDLRKRLNASFAELMDINKGIKQQKERKIGKIDDEGPVKSLIDKKSVAEKEQIQESTDDQSTKRREFIRSMMEHAWNGYVEHGWGHGEVRPDTLKGHDAGIFGGVPFGASIVDALDTLHVMGMNAEFQKARKWVAEELVYDRMRSEVSVFEFTIRYLGGLLSAYALSEDEIFLTKSEEIAKLLLPAFNTPSGIPYSLLNLQTKQTRNYGWANSGCSILAEVGTLHMEFAYLSHLTGDPVYKEKVDKIREVLQKQPKDHGLYRNYLNPRDGSWCGDDTSIGALGDSFYEYLLKDWLRTGRSDASLRDMFDEAVEAIRSRLSQRTASGFFYFSEWRHGSVQHRVDHLSCYFGGTLALGSLHVPDKTKRRAWFDEAVEFTRTCHESYVRSATRLGPDTFHMSGNELISNTPQERVYLLRPEVIESYFYLWRLTHNETYREWAWDAAQAIEKHCRAKAGYSGLNDVYSATPMHDDVQQSYFLAETLKYLYLIFSPDSVLPLDKWVFNTEAHPFPIQT